MSAEFLVKWNPEAYGDVSAKYVSMKDFIDDGIELREFNLQSVIS